MAYAENTKVTVERSKAAIEKLLFKYGATNYLYGMESGKALIMFIMDGRHIKMVLDLPVREDDNVSGVKAYNQMHKQKWRALYIVLKAKLIAIEEKIATLEDEFLPYTVLPDGRTVSEFINPQIDQAYLDGKMPKMLMLTE